MQQSTNPFPYNFFRLPESSKKEEQTLISLHDASGSMSSAWKHNAESYNRLIENIPNVITTTFSNNASRASKHTLTSNINDYESSGTNIESAFKLLIDILQTEKFQSNKITIIFVSDGQDSQSNIQGRLSVLKPKLEELSKQFIISFICVGVGSGFPTFLAMDLRQMLHSGDSAIPPVFLVDTNSSETFNSVYSQLVEHVTQMEQFELSSPVILYPWVEEQTSIAYAGHLVLTSNQVDVMKIKDGEILLLPEQQISMSDILKLGAQWMSVLQLESLKRSVGKEAEIAIQFMDHLLNRYLSHQEDGDVKSSVMRRIRMRQHESTLQPIYNIKSQLKLLIDQQLGQLSEAQAAKRLAIGTQVGKYHKVALKFCGINVDDFRQIRDDAVKVLESSKINYEESDQEQSIFSLQNTKDVLAEEDLIGAIKQCDDQFDAVNVVPLIGMGIKIKRFDGALVNIWLLEIQSVARVHSTIDTLSLYQKQDKQVELKIGNDEVETVNVVLPLFGTKDLDLKDFIRTRFFNLLMTFNVIHNVDTCFDTSHASLSANVLHFLLIQEPTTWRDELIKKIMFNFHLKYDEEEEFNNMKTQMLSENPSLALTSENPSLTFRCEDPSKALINLLDLIYRKPDDIANNLETIANHYVCEALARQIKTYDQIESALFSQQLSVDVQKFDTLVAKLALILEDDIKEKKFSSILEFRQKASNGYTKLDLLEGYQVEEYMNPNQLKLPNSKYSVSNLKKIYSYLTGKELNESLLQCILIHAWRYRHTFERNKTPIDQDSSSAYEYLYKTALTEIYSRKDLTESLIVKYRERFVEYSLQDSGDVHTFITPMRKSTLLKMLKGNQELFDQLHYYKRINIFKNTCMCPGCPHYLEPGATCQSNMEHPRSRYLLMNHVKTMRNKPLHEIIEFLEKFSKVRLSMINEPMVQHLKECYMNLQQ